MRCCRPIGAALLFAFRQPDGPAARFARYLRVHFVGGRRPDEVFLLLFHSDCDNINSHDYFTHKELRKRRILKIKTGRPNAVSEKLSVVGQYTGKFNALTGQALPCCDIVQSSGLAVHVQKHHPNEVGNLALVPQIISAPDYIGHNPKEPNSIELVKVLSANVMVCVKLNADAAYHYVASVYEISNGKLQKRIQSGRLKKF